MDSGDSHNLADTVTELPVAEPIVRVAVLGAGAWGTTLAKLSAEEMRPVFLWSRNPELVETLRVHRTRHRPPNLMLPSNVEVTTDLATALDGVGLIIVAISSSGLRLLFERMKLLIHDRLGKDGPAVLCATKGLEVGTGLLPIQVFEEVMGTRNSMNFVALGGPSHAEEVASADPMPTAVVLAGQDWAVQRVRKILNRPYFRVYILSKDPRGDCLAVELGGALKNIIAIAVGMCVGMGYGDNTQAAIISRGLREITRAVRHIYPDVNSDILAGIAGLGDLVGTAMSQHSRNRHFGVLLAKGYTAEKAYAEVGQVVEGANAASAMHKVAEEHGIHMPLTKVVRDVVHANVPLERAVKELLSRDTGPEDL